MSLKEAQERIDSAEFEQWKAYYQIEPFGQERSDLRAAIIATTIANSFRDKKARAFKIEDFMPNFNKPKKEMSVNQMAKTFALFANTHNAKLNKKKSNGN